MSKSLAVKYRPHGWDAVVEQSSVKAILQNQLESGEVKNAYIFVGSAGCGKTTCARIFANAINHGQGAPIEMDAASNNSVEDVRNIAKMAQTKSMNSEYKVFIIDECFTGETELLTDRGYVRFDKLLGDEKVAQWSDDGHIQFVEPIRFIKKHYKDDLVCWSPRNGKEVRMTKHHIQPLHYIKSNQVKSKFIQDVRFSQTNNLVVSGIGDGCNNTFSDIDRLAVAVQADGVFQHKSKLTGKTHWTIQVKKQRKKDRLLKLLENSGTTYKQIKPSPHGDTTDEYIRYSFDLPGDVSKLFSTHFHLDEMGYSRAKSFIEELQYWDGSSCDDYIQYNSVVKENVDFASAVAPLAGYSARQSVRVDNRSVNYQYYHVVRLYERTYSNCQHIKKTVHYEPFDGDVYCVEVPSHKIFVRADGFTFMTGNCHMFSQGAWAAMLKLIEEPPARSIFIMCTTDYWKIPKTILSRSQRYTFNRISQAGIVKRLYYILSQEWGQDADYYLNGDGALEYIARLSDGGMRDAITTLDKCLAYSTELTLDNVVKALGGSSFDELFELTDAILSSDFTKIINIVEEIYCRGDDMKQFVKGYLDFCMDIYKVKLTKSVEFTKFPDTDDFWHWIKEEFADYDLETCLKTLIKDLIALDNDIKWSQHPKNIIEARLLSL